MCGVAISRLPWNPASAYPWSSVRMTITFGGPERSAHTGASVTALRITSAVSRWPRGRCRFDMEGLLRDAVRGQVQTTARAVNLRWPVEGTG